MESSRLIVVGGGAAGMMAAIAAAGKGACVTLFEKRERPGRKIMITGKGRCNFTNTKKWQEFSTHIHPNKKFLKHSFYSFSNEDTIAFFKSIGVDSIIERGDRVFPESGKAVTIVDALVNEMNRLKVKVLYNKHVTGFVQKGSMITGVVADGKIHECGAVIIAAGGLSYPSTGSTGDGYVLAESAGHTITPLFPSLTALKPDGYKGEAIGMTLKNIGLKLYVGEDMVQEETGDIDFTNNGIEGSLGFRVSRKAVKALINGNRCYLEIDLKPAVKEEELKSRIEKELEQFSGYSIPVFSGKFMPSKIINIFLTDNNLPLSLKGITGKKLFPDLFCKSLKNWKFEIVSYTSYERAVVTAGGVSLDEVFPKSLKSRICENLFFAGEVIDLDGDTGGYNLQIAFSTGYKAGEEAAYLILKSTKVE